MKPRVICLMMAPLDGRVDVKGWSETPGGNLENGVAIYQEVHDALNGDAWIVGRITMESSATGKPHAPANAGPAKRPFHFANKQAARYAIVLDPSGKLHWGSADLHGEHLVMLLGSSIANAHLNELASDGISYIVAEDAELNLAAMLDVLGRELGIRRLLLEGGGVINGSFLAAGLVDEIHLLLFPAVDGRTSARTIFEAGQEGLKGKVQLALTSCDVLRDGVVHLRYAVEAG
jgi:riboflavin biosynthesis pyrimidine reductase